MIDICRCWDAFDGSNRDSLASMHAHFTLPSDRGGMRRGKHDMAGMEDIYTHT